MIWRAPIKTGPKFCKVQPFQSLQILAKFWGNGKTFTMDHLRSDMHIASPGARISVLKESGFNVKSSTSDDNFGAVGRPVSAYSIPRRRVSA